MASSIEPQEEISSAAEQAPRRKTGTMDVLRALRQPRVAGMLALGFSCGLPFMLVGNTLGFWLREEGIELAAIGFLSWVGMAYTIKFLWAPIVDKVDVPILGKLLGRRRGWAAFSQVVVGAALIAMAMVGPEGGLTAFVTFAVIAAFGSATQDIVIDAWRIERAETDEELALLSAAHGIGYRIALLCTDALILILAAKIGWSTSYVTAGIAMGVGLVAVLLSLEPTRRNPVLASALDAPPLWTPRGFYDAVAGPFVAFFKTHGRMALLMLAAISLFRLPDFVMGPMAAPFYTDLGIAKETVGLIRGTFGLWGGTVLGGVVCGLFAVRFGFTTTLMVGAVLGPISNLAFTVMALTGPDLTVFTIAMVVDNFSGAFAGLALVAYMSSLTSVGYTATQYALLTSFYALLGKFLKGFSGAAVEGLQASHGLLGGYAWFFAGTAAIGIPVVILTALLAAQHRKEKLRLTVRA